MVLLFAQQLPAQAEQTQDPRPGSEPAPASETPSFLRLLGKHLATVSPAPSSLSWKAGGGPGARFHQGRELGKGPNPPEHPLFAQPARPALKGCAKRHRHVLDFGPRGGRLAGEGE